MSKGKEALILNEEEKPPGTICGAAPGGVCTCIGYWGVIRCGEMDTIRHLSSPDLRARFRDEPALLGYHGALGW